MLKKLKPKLPNAPPSPMITEQVSFIKENAKGLKTKLFESLAPGSVDLKQITGSATTSIDQASVSFHSVHHPLSSNKTTNSDAKLSARILPVDRKFNIVTHFC